MDPLQKRANTVRVGLPRERGDGRGSTSAMKPAYRFAPRTRGMRPDAETPPPANSTRRSTPQIRHDPPAASQTRSEARRHHTQWLGRTERATARRARHASPWATRARGTPLPHDHNSAQTGFAPRSRGWANAARDEMLKRSLPRVRGDAPPISCSLFYNKPCAPRTRGCAGGDGPDILPLPLLLEKFAPRTRGADNTITGHRAVPPRR